MPVIRVENLSYTYSPGTPFAHDAIQNVNFELSAGEITGVIGHTGSGKSTLVQHLNGLVRATEGTVLLEGKDIWAEPKKIRDVRFKVGIVFQYPEYQLFDEMVYKDIAFGPTNMGLPQQEIQRRVIEAAELVGLQPALLEKSPFDLSGGEKRRAAIAGVIAMQPNVLVLDEPTAGLDPQGRELIFSLIKKYRDKTGAAVVIISHSMEDIAKIADKILVMNAGTVFMFDTVEKVFSQEEKLRSVGLTVPRVTQILKRLQNAGIPIDANAFTVQDAVQRVADLLQRGSEHA